MFLPVPIQVLRLVFLQNEDAQGESPIQWSFFGIPIVLLLTFVLTLVILIIVLRKLGSDKRDMYLGSILITATVIPMIAAGILVVVYLLVLQADPGGDLEVKGIYSVMFSLVLALISWVILAAFYSRFAKVDTANVGSYNELVARLDRLRARYESCREIDPGASKLDQLIFKSALEEVESHINYLSAVLLERNPNQQSADPNTNKGSALRWVLATGYINLWQRLHQAEEALVEVEHPAHVIRGAVHDELRLTDSTIANSPALLAKLRRAVAVLSAHGARYLMFTPATDAREAVQEVIGAARDEIAQTAPGTVPQDTQASTGAVAQGGDQIQQGQPATGSAQQPTGANLGNIHGDQLVEHFATLVLSRIGAALPKARQSEIELTSEARSILREIRHNVNSFRDDSWMGLVRARNDLLQTITFIGTILYALLLITVLMQVPKFALLAATVFFLVGAITGLFRRLQQESSEPYSNEDDYGFSRAKLIHTPIFSGLAAVGGVLLFAMVPLAVSAAVVLPGEATPTSVAANATATNTLVVSRSATITPTPTRTPQSTPTGGAQAIPTDTPTLTPTLALTAIASPTSSATATVTPLGDVSIGPGEYSTAKTDLWMMVLQETPDATPFQPTPTSTGVVATSTSISDNSGDTGDQTNGTDGQANGRSSTPLLENIFNLDRNRFGLIIAATFGLLPNLLVRTLEKQVEQYKKDIRSTEASDPNESRSR